MINNSGIYGWLSIKQNSNFPQDCLPEWGATIWIFLGNLCWNLNINLNNIRKNTALPVSLPKNVSFPVPHSLITGDEEQIFEQYNNEPQNTTKTIG